MDIRLNFINRSNDTSGCPVVVFSQDRAANQDELAVAWQVIRYCAPGDNHPFAYPQATQVCASDSFGNYSPRLQAEPGQLFQMVRDATGDRLVLAGDGSNPTEIELLNAMPSGSMDAYLYKAGKVFATKSNVAPGQKAVFAFKPAIYIGVVSQVEEGQVMDSAIVSSVNTEISLLGIASADIVMTGGGSGADARPFQFSLANVVAA